MKDIDRLQALSPTSPSANPYGSFMAGAATQAIPPVGAGRQDRVSLSPVAERLRHGQAEPLPKASPARLASLQDRILADSLEIDVHRLAERMLDELSHD